MDSLPTLSLWQPWASLIALRLKQYETRSWPAPPIYVGHLLAIHAAKRWTRAEERFLDQLRQQVIPSVARQLPLYPPLGAVVCVCRLVECIPTDRAVGLSWLEQTVGNWSPGRYGWKLEVVKVFEQPIPLVGRQGIFRWQLPEDVAAALNLITE